MNTVIESTKAQWAPDPFGSHQMRYWDGSTWTEHVLDDNLPSRDPLVEPSTSEGATSVEPKPLISWQMHALLALLTIGLWLLIAPAIHWLRKGAYKTAAAWVTAWVVLAAVSATAGGVGSDGSVTTSTQPTGTGIAQGLVGGGARSSAPTSTSPTRTKTKTKTRAATKPTSLTTASSATPRKTSTKTKAMSTTKTATAPKTDPHFGTCKQANAAGHGNYHRGVDPEYAWYHDRDGDGIVCEFRG